MSWWLALGLALAATPAGPGPELVLEQGQQRWVEQLVELRAPELPSGHRLDGVAVEQTRAVVTVVDPDGASHPVSLHASGQAGATVDTPVGALVAPESLDPAVVRALAERMRGSPIRLRWKRLILAADPVVASADARSLRDRIRARLDGSSPAAPPRQPAPLDAGTVPVPGQVSDWLHAGGDGVPCTGCRATDALRAIADGHVDQLVTARWGDEPGILVAAARSHAELGQAEVAAAVLWQALAHPLAGPDALALADAWGWRPQHAPAADGGGSSWPLWLALVALLAAVAVLRREVRPAQLGALAVALGGALLVVVSVGGGDGPEHPALPTPSDGWLSLGRGTGCAVSPPAVSPGRWEALVRCGDAATGVVITAGQLDEAEVLTPGHSVVVHGWEAADTLAGDLEPWLRRLHVDLLALEAAGQGLAPAVDPTLASAATTGERLARRPHLERRAHAATAAVAMLAALALLGLLLSAGRTLAPHMDRWLWGLLAVAVVAHAVGPPRMVMVYSGYTLVHQLVEWEALRYGAGANWIYGPWLALLGADHAVVQLANRVLGVSGLLLLWALASRLFPGRPRVVHAVALLTAVAPILWRDHASESILVGPTVLLLGALYAVASAARRRLDHLILAAPCALLAAMSRPELAVSAAALALVVLGHVLPRWPARAWAAVGLLVGACAAASVDHLTYMTAAVDALVDTGALPGLSGLAARAREDLFALGGQRVIVDHGPVLLAGLLVLSIVPRGSRVLVLGVGLTAFAWMAITRVDLPDVSIPRVHAPAWTLLCLPGAVGLHAVWRWATDRGRGPLAAALLAAAWVASAAVTVEPLYRATNADAEEALLRDVEAHVPVAPGACLVTLDERDPPPPGKTHRFFPYYRFADRAPAPVTSNLSDLDLTECPGGAWAVLGMRCYMHLREDESVGPAPEGTPRIAGCRAFTGRWQLRPVVERDVPNAGDVAFPMYPSGGPLRIGLYEVVARRQ